MALLSFPEGEFIKSGFKNFRTAQKICLCKETKQLMITNPHGIHMSALLLRRTYDPFCSKVVFKLSKYHVDFMYKRIDYI